MGGEGSGGPMHIITLQHCIHGRCTGGDEVVVGGGGRERVERGAGMWGGGGRLQNASFFTPKPESFVQIRKMAMGTIIFYEILYSL